MSTPSWISALDILACDKLALLKSVFFSVAHDKLAPERFAPEKEAFSRFEKNKSAEASAAFLNVAPLRLQSLSTA